MWLPHWIFSKISFFFSFFWWTMSCYLLLLFSILFIYAFDFYKKCPSFHFVYSVFTKTSHSSRNRLGQHSFKAQIPSSLDLSPRGLVGKVHEKVIEERRWKAKGLPDESHAWDLAVKNIFSLPKNEWAESNVTLKENENAWRAGCGPELPCNWIPPWDLRLRHTILCREGPASPAEIWTPQAFLFGEFLI